MTVERSVLAIDVGGTFTDVVARLADGRLLTAKVPSTPADPSLALVEGIAELCRQNDLEVREFAVLLHGTTIATNAILQRRGARTALITTQGFRDVLQIARQSRPRLFDADPVRPQPLVERGLRFEAVERLTADGREFAPLDLASVDAIADQLRAARVEAVAVCLLHSYANSAHERAVRDRLRDRLPNIHITISTDVLTEYREYERTSTAVINAYVAPLAGRYFAAIGDRLRDVHEGLSVRVMQSSGGLMNLDRAGRVPAATVLSGVAAGAVGGASLGRLLGLGRVVTLDMGGTSTDIAIAIDGGVRTVRSHQIDGLPIRLPAIDVQTIGAGGGSIAYVDQGGSLRVGPRSAGAVPGPAAYGLGGLEPTVTDANLVLGRLPARGLLGGQLALHPDRAEESVQALATRLGLDLETTAEGILRVVNATMERQIRVLTIERGVDPRTCALIGFGGGGPVHAVALATGLGIGTVLVPPHPGVTSALGLLLSDTRVDLVQTAMIEIPPEPTGHVAIGIRLEALFADLERRATLELPAGDRPGAPALVREVEARYRRQGHELRVRAPGGPLGKSQVAAIVEAFRDVHRARYGYVIDGEPVVIVNVLATAILARDFEVTFTPRAAAGRQRETRRVFFDGTWRETAIVPRESIAVGETFDGPLIVEQYDTTTIVPPGARCHQDPNGFLIIDIGSA